MYLDASEESSLFPSAVFCCVNLSSLVSTRNKTFHRQRGKGFFVGDLYGTH